MSDTLANRQTHTHRCLWNSFCNKLSYATKKRNVAYQSNRAPVALQNEKVTRYNSMGQTAEYKDIKYCGQHITTEQLTASEGPIEHVQVSDPWYCRVSCARCFYEYQSPPEQTRHPAI